MHSPRRSLVLLALGAAGGLALASARLVAGPAGGPAVPPDAVALVNGVPIDRDDFDRALAALDADRRAGLRAGDPQRVLERLVDEELLLQRALELGLARRDPRVRGQLVSAVIDTALADASAREPAERRLRVFYERHRAYFARPGRVRIVHRVVAGDGVEARAASAALADALRAGRLPPAAAEAGTVPDALLPIAKLEELLGPSVVRAALELPVGGVSEPIRSTGGYHVVRVEEREPDVQPPFEEVRPLVREELARRRSERALRTYLKALRREAHVVLGEPGA